MTVSQKVGSYLVFTCLALLPSLLWAAEFDNNRFCNLWKSAAAKTNKEGPVWVDTITRLDGVAVICSLKHAEFKKFIKVPQSQFRPGWQGRKQRQWNSIYCRQATLLAIRHGWRIEQLLTFVDGSQHRISANCK